jgi:hypothetical protein
MGEGKNVGNVDVLGRGGSWTRPYIAKNTQIFGFFPFGNKWLF